MNNFLIGYIAGFAYVFGIILFIGILYKVFKLNHELSRKLIHVFLCYTWVILYKYFYGSPQILVIPIAFIIVNALSYKFKLFKAIEREDENHLGTVYFAIAMTVLMIFVLIFPDTIEKSGIAVFALCFGDGFAAIVGQYGRKKIVGNKTWLGTFACFVFSFIGIALSRLFVTFEVNIWKWLVISLISAITELCGMGLDNFSLTFSVYIASILLLK